MADLTALIALSRRYGSDPEWVLAGGGNTSFKEAGRLFVKASGTSLGSITDAGFCSIDRTRLDAMWRASYPAEPEAREAAALADLMASRCPGENKRPSVETLMHGLFPQAYVVHTHPAAVNGITCGRDGKAVFARLFADEGIWVPFVDPGYTLAKVVRAALEDFRGRGGKSSPSPAPAIMLMQNHGLLIAGESPAEVEAVSARVMAKVRAEVKRLPDLTARPADALDVAAATATLASLVGVGACIRFRADAETLARSSSGDAFAPLSSSFTPDHIVYAGHEFLLAEGGLGGIAGAWADFVGRNGVPPRIVLVPGLGAFSCAKSPAAADAAILLYADACKVAAYAESFGGALHMTKEKIDFIRNWEVEKYRSSVSVEK
ncbi:MAG: class II aldolase/adducin family protein [Rectinemataceae bacterium]|jgi:rhamnose utilization protein RhaD (predicted bifunctional aldolase and dehydrogenase)